MSKHKFKPRIARIKLTPEQAVLTCTCYNVGRRDGGGTPDWGQVCRGGKSSGYTSNWGPENSSS